MENVTLIRRWIKDPGLRVQEKTIGDRTRTKVILVFLADLAPNELIKEVHKRLDAIEIDAVLESGYLEELITDERLTIFPLIQATERSDKVTAAILEGRIAILVDKSPSAPNCSCHHQRTLSVSGGLLLRVLVGKFFTDCTADRQ